MQTRTQSLIEVAAGLAVGFTVSVIAGRILYPVYGLHPTMGQNVWLTLWFTGISLVRSYAVRRLFNWIFR